MEQLISDRRNGTGNRFSAPRRKVGLAGCGLGSARQLEDSSEADRLALVQFMRLRELPRFSVFEHENGGDIVIKTSRSIATGRHNLGERVA
jgi:hypothetical protein